MPEEHEHHWEETSRMFGEAEGVKAIPEYPDYSGDITIVTYRCSEHLRNELVTKQIFLPGHQEETVGVPEVFYNSERDWDKRS